MPALRSAVSGSAAKSHRIRLAQADRVILRLCDTLPFMETYLAEADDKVIVIVADGGLNKGTAEQITQVVQQAIDCGMKGVIIDCSKLDILSSAGLGKMLMLHKQMKQHGGEVKIAGLHGMAVQVLRLTRLDGIFQLYPDVSQARLAFRGT